MFLVGAVLASFFKNIKLIEGACCILHIIFFIRINFYNKSIHKSKKQKKNYARNY